MSKLRQNAWSVEEDTFLKESIINHILDNSTQIEAFKFVGEKLNRTPSACGFRWNSVVRKGCVEEIKTARLQAQNSVKGSPVNSNNEIHLFVEPKSSQSSPVVDNPLQFIEKLHLEKSKEFEILEDKHKIESLESKVEHLNNVLLVYQNAWNELNDKLTSLSSDNSKTTNTKILDTVSS